MAVAGVRGLWLRPRLNHPLRLLAVLPVTTPSKVGQSVTYQVSDIIGKETLPLHDPNNPSTLVSRLSVSELRSNHFVQCLPALASRLVKTKIDFINFCQFCLFFCYQFLINFCPN